MIQRLLLWLAAALLATSLALWGLSLFHITWRGAPRPFHNLHLWNGELGFGPGISHYTFPGLTVFGFELKPQVWWPAAEGFYESISYTRPAGSSVTVWRTHIPLWMPAAASALTLGAIVWRRRHIRLKYGDRACPRCHYDLHGLPDGAGCPECGLGIRTTA